MGPARCSLFGRDRRASHVLCEIGSLLAKSLRKTKKGRKKSALCPQNSLGIHRPLVLCCNRYVDKDPHVKVQDRYLPSF